MIILQFLVKTIKHYQKIALMNFPPEKMMIRRPKKHHISENIKNSKKKKIIRLIYYKPKSE